MSGISPGRCLWDATTQLTEQQQVMDTEWGCRGQCLLSYSESSMNGLVPVCSSLGQHTGSHFCQTLTDVKVGMLPSRQETACHWKRPIITILFPFPMTSLLSLTPLSSRQVLTVCGCTRDSYMSSALVNFFFRSVFSNLSFSLSNCVPNNTAGYLFVRAIMDQMGDSLICSGLLSKLSVFCSLGLSEDVLLFIWSVRSNLRRG